MSTDYKEQINELKDSLRIEDVIGAYVHLEHKAGGKCLGICPFHDDSHPSMSVHKGKQIFKCFSCDVGGDVFAFIQKREQCSFVDAVKILRERFAGGSVPLIMHTPVKVQSKPKLELTPAQQEALEAQNHRFLLTLYCFHPDLADVGELDIPTGFTPQASLTSQTSLPSRQLENHPPTQLEIASTDTNEVVPLDSEEVGSIGTNYNDSKGSSSNLTGVKAIEPSGKYHPDCRGIAQTYVDFEVGMAGRSVPHGFAAMAGRIIFPIRDANGRLVGFAGRTTFNPTQEQKKYVKKYMNSSSDGLYKKNETLYGLFQASNAIRNEGFCFLNEGYKDVLAMVAAGYPNSVAQCGAAFTNDQALLLKKYTSRVAVLMDADERGRNIAAEAIKVLQKNGIQTCDLVLPPGEDPDSLFRRLGRKSFRAIIRESQLTDQIQSTTPKNVEILQPKVETEAKVQEEVMLASDRPRLEAREVELQQQIDKLYTKRFITGSGPDRIQLNIDLMNLHSQLKQIAKQLNRPKVWY
ncbi:MAG: CHC2 zinc finger domain-containing protein [Parabacteroides sp.]|nr:CHC2 zinc finger domain-containing protein [Parabacteroides sp.]